MSKKMKNDNEIVLSYDDSLLRNSDVDLLRGPEWLNDTIIGFYFEYLNKKMSAGDADPDTDFVKKFLYVSPELTQLLKLTALSDYEILLESINARSNSFVFFPLNNCDSRENAGGTHWSLIVYSGPEKKCYHYDSAKGFNSAIAKTFAKNLTDYFCGKDLGNYMEVDIPQQKNGHDCGLYLLCCSDLITDHAVTYSNVKNCSFESLNLSVKEKRKNLLQLINYLKNIQSETDE